MPKVKGLRERLAEGDVVIVAEGYCLELEQRGYVSAGPYTPEVVLENPDVVRMLSKEFVHAGSDVVEGFTYYAHREKMQDVGREDEVELLNRNALRIAREVADESGTLMAGGLCTTHTYTPETRELSEEIFKEQIQWIVEEKADYIIAETFESFGEAMVALECIKKYGNGLPAVVTMSPRRHDDMTYDDVPMPEACRSLEQAGADVVGLNCSRGPDTILPILKQVRQSCKGPIACLPVAYRTTEKYKRFFDLRDPTNGELSLHGNLNPWLLSRFDVERFTKQLQEIGVQYMGLCCGNQAHYTRTMAETLGRRPPASKYSPDMKHHFSNVKDKYGGNTEIYLKDLDNKQ